MTELRIGVHVWCTVPKNWTTGYNRSLPVKFFTSPKKIILVKEKKGKKKRKKEKGKSHFMGFSLPAPKEDQGVEETVQKISFSLCFTLCLCFLLFETWYGYEFSHSFMSMLFQIVICQFLISVLFCTIWVS